jgi:aminomethyltransferase
MTTLRRTPLHETHLRLGGRMVEFGGWELPVQYSSIVAEHTAVRERAGLFDVSHMGQIHLRGDGAVASAERLLTCEVTSLPVGAVRYGLLCNEDGGVRDDVTLYRVAPTELFLCVNAANTGRDLDWILRHARGATVEDRSEQTAMLALQGPAGAKLLARVGAATAASLGRFRFAEMPVAGRPALVSNTGYTGAPGFELYLAAADATAVFTALLESGGELGVLPAGLGARDTLRLEAALPLYGHELSEARSPLQAGLDRFVKRKLGGFLGAEAIERRAVDGHAELLVGFELEERGVARAGHAILHEQATVGHVTSGGPSPTLGRGIGLGYVFPDLTEKGTALGIEVRGRRLAARVVETPFVSVRRPGREPAR